MIWNSSHIDWAEQVLVLSILLPPIFISAMLLAVAAPRLLAPAKKQRNQQQGALGSGSPVSQSR